MLDETELLFRELPLSINGSIAIDLHSWTFLFGVSRQAHVVSSWGKIWKEWVLWLGPVCVTLTFYGDGE